MNGIMDLVHNIKVTRAFASAQVTGDTNGLIVDTQGFQQLTILALIAAVATADADNKIAFEAWESDDDDFSDGSEVQITGDRLISSPIVINATSMANSAQKMGVALGTKRYVRLQLNETGTADATFGALFVLSGARHKPVA
jgi:hypothetical protein